MVFKESDLARMNRFIDEGEQRIANQEELIERLRADGHKTDAAEDFLRKMKELRVLQLKLREDAERLLKDQNSLESTTPMGATSKRSELLPLLLGELD